MEIINKIREEAKIYFTGMPQSHDWGHVDRVYKMAISIAKKENADIFTVSIASLLHDIGRKKEMQDPKNLDHAKIGSEMAIPILARYNIPEDISKNIVHSIASHRYRSRGNDKPETIEAKVLFDADKLDSIGAIGIARAYAWAGEQNPRLYSDKVYLGAGYEKEHSPVTEFKFKLCKVKERMLTTTGKINAHHRHKIMEKFFKSLESEIKGNVI
jgi:uncharacterized protein